MDVCCDEQSQQIGHDTLTVDRLIHQWLSIHQTLCPKHCVRTKGFLWRVLKAGVDTSQKFSLKCSMFVLTGQARTSGASHVAFIGRYTFTGTVSVFGASWQVVWGSRGCISDGVLQSILVLVQSCTEIK